MRFVRAAAVAAGLVLTACSSASSSAAPSVSPPAVVSTLATTKAADLRTHLDLLLGERVILIAKQAEAASQSTDEYPGYVSLLGANTAELETIFRLAFGNTAASSVGDAWKQLNSDLIEYTVGLVTHKDSQVSAAQAHLYTASVPLVVQRLSDASGLAAAAIQPLLSQQLQAIEQILTDVAGQAYGHLYPDLHAGYAATATLGDLLAETIARSFPDKFPGDPSVRAVTLRASLNAELQEHAYLTTFATDAQAAHRAADAAAATVALATSATGLGNTLTDLYSQSTGQLASELWAAGDAAVISYAADPGKTPRATVVETFVLRFQQIWKAEPGPVADQLRATLGAVDEQLAKSFTKLAADDRAAATAMQPIADELVAGASAQS